MAIIKGKTVEFDTSEGVSYQNNDGETRMRLNPEQKARKYCVELSTGKDVYTGKKLTKGQKAWRAGYMGKVQENTRIYNSKNQKKN